MSTPEEIEVVNNTVLLASLREDIIQASTGLSHIYAEKKRAEDATLEAQEELKDAQEQRAETLKVIEEALTAFKQAELEHTKAISRFTSETKVLREQKKSLMSELTHLNDWIFTGQEKVEELTAHINTLDVTVKSKNDYIANIQEFIDLKTKAETEYQNVLIDTKLTVDESNAVLDKNKSELASAQDELKKSKLSLAKAEEDLAEAVRQKSVTESELQIYIGRVSDLYKEAFPDREIKL